MSTISVSNITTANGTEALTIATGNTEAGDIVINSSGGLVLAPNSTVNSVIVSVGAASNALVTNSTGVFVSQNSVIVSTGTPSNTFVTNSTGLFVSGNVNIDTGVLFVDGVNNRVGIGNTTPDANLTVTGTANISSNVVVGNYVTANVFSGAANLPLSPRVTVAGVAGTFLLAPTITATISGTLALTANRQYFIPIYVPYVLTTTTLACEVTTLGSGSSIRMNIYAADANGAPTGSPLGTDVNVSSATIGVKTGAYAVTLKPGLYWASMVCNATAPTVRTNIAAGVVGVSTLGATSSYSYIFGTFTFGVMGAYSSVTSITGASPTTQCPLMAIY
jgi:hypothetical protein